jgi:hypothetical protein
MKNGFLRIAKTVAPLLLVAALGTGTAFAAGRGGFRGGRGYVAPRVYGGYVGPRYYGPSIGLGFGFGAYPYVYAPYGYAPYAYPAPYGYAPPSCGGYYDQNGVWQPSPGCTAPPAPPAQAAPAPAPPDSGQPAPPAPGAPYGY